MTENNHKQILRLLFRHGLISITCGSLEFLSFMFFYTHLHLPLIIAYTCSFLIATSVGFVGHSHITFAVGTLRKRNALLFSLQALCALTLGYLFIRALIEFGMPAMYAKMSQLILVFFFNVSFGKLISFKRPQS